MPNATPMLRWSLAFGLSIAFHAWLMWRAESLPRPPSETDDPRKGALRGELRARLASPPQAEATPPARPSRSDVPPAVPPPPGRAREAPAPRLPVARSTPPMAPTVPPMTPAVPPRITGSTPTQPVPPSQPTVPRESPAASAAAPADMSAMIEARRRAREGLVPRAPDAEARDASEDDAARRERAVAANLGSLKAPSPGENRQRGGGVFQLRRLGTEEATFLFFGWNREMGRNNTQQIEVRRGANPSIELAIVRRMIAIIREYESGDFLWQSQRLGHSVTLSARAADNASLEAFMLREFF